MHQKLDAHKMMMEQVLSFLDKFKHIDKAIDNLCKNLSKTSVSNSEFQELMKLYNTTGSMFLKALDILNSIMCKFPQELMLDELEIIEYYRGLTEAEKFIYRERMKKDSKYDEQ